MNKPTDRYLLERDFPLAVQSDPAAVQFLYDHHDKSLRAWARRKYHDLDECEDILQQTWMVALGEIFASKIREPKKLAGWLRTTFKNLVKREFGRLERVRRNVSIHATEGEEEDGMPLEEALADPKDTERPVEDLAASQAQIKFLKDLKNALPSEKRRVEIDLKTTKPELSPKEVRQEMWAMGVGAPENNSERRLKQNIQAAVACGMPVAQEDQEFYDRFVRHTGVSAEKFACHIGSTKEEVDARLKALHRRTFAWAQGNLT